MTSTTYFGRAKHDSRRLGADFDLLAKWTRTFSLGHPIHSYYLTQLSDEDRAQLFTGPAQEFRLEEGPNNTVKLETLQDEVNRIDPEVIDMMKSANYQRTEARRLELLAEIEDAQDDAGGAAALALSNAILRGMDGPPAEKLAKQVADKILDSASAKVKARWKAARDERLKRLDEETFHPPQNIHVNKDTAETTTTTIISHGPEFIARWNAATRERLMNEGFKVPTFPQLASIMPECIKSDKAVFDMNFSTTVPSHSADIDKSQITPQLKHAAKFITSPHGSIPDYGSETSSDSAHWNSPRCSADESLSSPDLESVTGLYDDSNGGVALLPSSLADELGPTSAPRSFPSHAQTHGGRLGTGLSQPLFSFPAFDHALKPTDSVAVTTYSTHSSSSPFSPNSKTSKFPVAKEQPWMGFTCYEIGFKFGPDQLVPKYWTTKRGKERYLRHKLGELKLDDAKLRCDRFSGSVARNPVHIFIDLSNIIIGFYDSMKESRGIAVNKRVMAPPFSFKNFDTILTRDRNVAKRIVAGSLANSYNKRWPAYMVQAQELKYEMNILERVPKPALSPVRKRKAKVGTRDPDAHTSGAETSGEDCFMGLPMKNGEQGVDELLHLKILQSAMDTPYPATMVLATGDAATAQYSDGFKKNIERVLAVGWNIELYGWSRNISSAWREPEFAKRWGHQFKIIELDHFCEELFDMTLESLEH
ncbi:hypothetical protein N657DRAFT_655444 [Parathielavia appendiculata]|uniref:NYN domain-containing protein n=1 Tax=Parathielavia appendiculata TaxID=2587402 RepID=A0AAN6U0G0_9PEZI|nr:hypothetical protein N657DRAFT_655444 [Parathielavia appendiculata]